MRNFFMGLALVAVIIVLQNWQSVNLQILFWQVRISQVLLLMMTGCLGLTLGYLLTKKRK
ncbi:MAG: DUF1049 domain-containing protein [Candidatus Omnitrophica bacterium]|nr:DUF1049 domain-containing protein [Candidatus Omnitrophota bacterium]